MLRFIPIFALVLASCGYTNGNGIVDYTRSDTDGRTDVWACGWEESMHVCGGEGHPARFCESLNEGELCGDVGHQGCCDLEGNLWFCDDGRIAFEACE